MEKKIRLILISIFAMTCAVGKAWDIKFEPEYSTIINASKGQEMMSQCSRNTPEGIDGFWDLAEEEVEELENRLNKIVRMRSTSGKRIRNLKKYGY
ncbi:MAG: hypothetical protein RIG62_24890 [Cyclobacteriaceae bacterium]